jgi:LmbE family N-acetylglucosaminyl deacetylase
MSERRAEPSLAAFADPRRPVLDGTRAAVVVAHPDDETIGCGALLARLPGVLLVHVTDGAPRDLVDAGRLGFPSVESYAAARRRELEAALAVGGVEAERVDFAIPDKEAVRHLAPLARKLTDLFEGRGVRLALTHAFEGGHPDHEACAFAVHHAARLAGGIATIEMPFYRLGPEGPVNQSFPPAPGRTATELRLTAAESARKAAMLDCFASQRSVLAGFSTDCERFSPAAREPAFARPPNDGRILYESWGWGLTGADFARSADAAERALASRPAPRLEHAPCL